MGRTTMKSDENQIAIAATLASAMLVVVTGAIPRALSHVHVKAAIFQILARGDASSTATRATSSMSRRPYSAL